MIEYSDFGIQARTIMLKKKITMTALAKEVGISCSYLSEIFKGSRSGASYQEKIKEILGFDDPDDQSA